MTSRADAISRMGRDELAGAWWAHVHRGTDDREARVAIALRARALGMTQRDLAAEAHAGGLISDAELAGYR